MSKTNGKELITELMGLLVKMENHCKNIPDTGTDGKCGCVDCSLSRYLNYNNSGCILQEIKHAGIINSIDDCMDYHNMSRDKYKDFLENNTWR